MKKAFLYLLLLAICFSIKAQPVNYTVANAHSHNDYEQPVLFWSAYNAAFGSVEADIFLVGGNLFVAHDVKELSNHRSLTGLYLEPLISNLVKNNGYPYADTSKHLQMLIDIKSDSIHTLEALIETLRKYDVIMNSHHLQWVITGNRPDQSLFTSYPPFISFDGVLDRTYSAAALTKIDMLSDEWRKYASWYGLGELSVRDLQKLKDGISKAHTLQKPVRFWGAPDSKNAWHQLMQLKVDYINTDHIAELAAYLSVAAN